MLRSSLRLASSLALLAGCVNPLVAPDDGTTAGASSDGTTTATTSCNPVLGGTGGAGLVTCGADQICIFATASGFDSAHTGCFPVVSSSTTDGDACSTLDACGPGQACTDQGCQTLCWVGDTCTGAVACQADTSVSLSVAGRSVGYCPPQSSCDLVGSTACAFGCTPYSDGHAQCRTTAGSSALGGACTSDFDCAAGLACDDAVKECSTYCRVGGTDCATGSCVTDGRAAITMAGVSYGYCSL